MSMPSGLPHAVDTKVNKADKVLALRQLNRQRKSHIIKQFQLRAKVSATARVTQWGRVGNKAAVKTGRAGAETCPQ